jgi:sulfide dehydrogenase cytochrome subunit
MFTSTAFGAKVGLRAVVAAVAGTMALAWPAAAEEGFRVSQTCAGCHGTDGAAPGHTIPIIGGQDATYIAKAMRAYKSGGRGYYVMQIIAAGFDDSQIEAMAGWFAARPWVATGTAHDAAKAAAGAAVAEGFCSACHGLEGEGTEVGPRLAGQPADYLLLAAEAYRSGERTDEIATAAMGPVSDAEVEAAAHYYASLR